VRCVVTSCLAHRSRHWQAHPTAVSRLNSPSVCGAAARWPNCWPPIGSRAATCGRWCCWWRPARRGWPAGCGA